VADLLTLEAAIAAVLARSARLPEERVALGEAAGRVLAEPARALVDLPPFASSAMDGFALRSADTPGRLPVVARIAAGSPAARALRPGEAMGIATGGVVPEGADAVVPIERVVSTDDSIDVPDPVSQNDNVRARGGDAREGDVVLEAGMRLGAAQIGALAAAGIPDVVCARRPRVAVLATGSELRAPGEKLEPGEIYEANGAMLEAALRAHGADVDRLAPARDDEGAHREALARALESDVVVSSGGVSVGPHDLVRRVAAELGVEEVFWRVAVKPGKPISFGVRDETLVFGLPGNPVSTLVGFELFVRPALRALEGERDPGPRFRQAPLARPVRRNVARDELVRARWQEGVLETLGGQESHMIVRAAVADALVLVPRGDGELAGEVSYLPLGY
jgi:molybdopterin molybdotransferase